MGSSGDIAAALRLVLDEPATAFDTLLRLRREALDAGASATASSVSRALVFAAKLAGDAGAELQFATEWHDQDGSESSARVLAAVRGAAGLLAEEDVRSVEREDLDERLVLLVERILTANLDRSDAISELTSIRSEALGSGATRIAARCLDELILAATELGETQRALEMAHDLVTEMPSARAFNILGRAATIAGETAEARRAFELALSNATQEGNMDEAAQARDGIAATT